MFFGQIHFTTPELIYKIMLKHQKSEINQFLKEEQIMGIAGNLLPLEGSPCLMPRYSPGMGVRGFPLTSALKCREVRASLCTSK